MKFQIEQTNQTKVSFVCYAINLLRINSGTNLNSINIYINQVNTVDELIQTHATTLAVVFGIKLQQKEKNLPQIYWIPKLHKTPYKARFIAGSRSCTTTRLSKLITECLKLVRSHCTAYCKTIQERTGVNSMWIFNNSWGRYPYTGGETAFTNSCKYLGLFYSLY